MVEAIAGRTLSARAAVALRLAAAMRSYSPSFTPRALAAARASFVRFEMASRSNSAIAAMMWMVSLFAWGLSNTVAEGGNRRWAEIARQKAFQSRWPRPTRGRPPGEGNSGN